jgi:hypothetical protein
MNDEEGEAEIRDQVRRQRKRAIIVICVPPIVDTPLPQGPDLRRRERQTGFCISPLGMAE